MYTLFFALLFGCSGWLIYRGSVQDRKTPLWIGGVGIAGGFALLLLMAFWAEMLWFDALGYASRFWTFFWAAIAVPAVGGLIAALLGLLLTRGAGVHLRRIVALICAAGGVFWGLLSWRLTLLFLNRVETDLTDPLLGFSSGFYLFTLPFLDSLFWLGLFVCIVALLAVLMFREIDGVISPGPGFAVPRGRLLIPGASLALAIVLAIGQLLSVSHLLYSKLGVVMGPGWTDVHIRLPALLLMAVVFLVAGALPLFAPFRNFMTRLASRWQTIAPPNIVAVIGAWFTIGIIWAVLVVSLPQLTQWLIVRPNEITFEIPYITRNIEFTRKGFKLDQIEERAFSAEAELDRSALADNEHLLSEVRLWDWRALDAVYKQFQEIRLYYEFVDVDIDRYQIGDRYRQVMVAARELAQRNLSRQSQTFVNKRFKYTHGYGYTLAPVSDFTSEGLPNLLVKNIPPVAENDELAVDRPEIYYGEMTDEPVVVNTLEPEFDYPSGETNVYTQYQGKAVCVFQTSGGSFSLAGSSMARFSYCPATRQKKAASCSIAASRIVSSDWRRFWSSMRIHTLPL